MGMIYKVHHIFKIKVRNYFEEQITHNTKWTNDDVAAISVIAMSKNELAEKNA